MGGYMPSTRQERAEMLRAIGLDRPEELFASVPEGLRVKKLDLAARARTTTTYPPWSAR